MYTSGTTGMPKGVMLSHANAVACIAGLKHLTPEFGFKGPGDVYIAYLPLAHIMEIAGEMQAFASEPSPLRSAVESTAACAQHATASTARTRA